MALGRTLAARQLENYIAIRAQLVGTLMPLDGLDIVTR